MVRALQIVLFLYLFAAAFTHPWLPGYPLTGTGRAVSAVIYLRELLILTIVAICMLHIIHKRNAVIVYIFIIYSIIMTIITAIFTDLPISIALRSILMITVSIVVPLAILNGSEIKNYVGTPLKIIILLYLIICFIQLSYIPPYYGATFLGSRVFAAAASPLNLSYTAGASAIFFATQREPSKFWVYACCVLTVVSGGRTGMMIALLAVCALVVHRFKADLPSKILGLIALLVIIVVASLIVSSPEISGREGTAGGPLQDQRFDVWWRAIYPWLNGTWYEFLFGLGVGLGSNASIGASINFSYTDSTFVYLLISYGLLGFTLTLTLIILSFGSNLSIFALLALALTATTQLIFELQPAFIILILSLHSEVEPPKAQTTTLGGNRQRRLPRIVWSR